MEDPTSYVAMWYPILHVAMKGFQYRVEEEEIEMDGKEER